MKGASRSHGTWDAPAFLQGATEKWKLTQNQLQAVARLLEFSSEQSDDCGWGAGKVYGSFNPKFLKVSPRSLYTVQDDGYLVINFAWLDANLRQRLADDLKTIPLFAVKIKQADGYPKFTVDEWRSEVDKFIAVINKVVS